MISVIVPVYNVEIYLRKCLDSILNQTYQNIEIILIDDGSPDKCGEICEEYARIDKRIRVFHTENRGLSAARNLGLQEAKGEYIGFVDSDDWIEPDMYEILLRRLEETGTIISASGVWSEYRGSRQKYSICDAVYTGTAATRILVCNVNNEVFSNGVWNKLYQKTCWKGIFFPENHAYEEIATLYKVFLKANSLSCVPLPLYHYRMREGSIVHTLSKQNLMDYWTAFYERCISLSKLTAFKEDRQMIDCLERQIATATIRTWIWTFPIPRKQRDYEFLHSVSAFVQTHFSIVGKKNWGWHLRVCFFFTRYANDVSFAIMYVLYRMYKLINNPISPKKLFPS